MGFFKKSLSSESKRTALTIIAKGNKIAGQMSVTGKLHVDGCVEGRITSIESVSIGRTGEVKGRIEAKNVTVSGVIEGEVFCDHLHLSAGGRVIAKVECCELTMDPKTQFIGERQSLKLPDFQKAMGLEGLVTKNALKAQQKMVDDQKVAIDDQNFLDDLPDKITLAPLDNSDLANIDADINAFEENVEKSEADEIIIESKVIVEKPKPTHIAKRTEQDLEKEQNIDRKKSSNRRKTTATIEKLSEEKVSEDKKLQSIEQHSGSKVTDENTMKVELKF